MKVNKSKKEINMEFKNLFKSKRNYNDTKS